MSNHSEIKRNSPRRQKTSVIEYRVMKTSIEHPQERRRCGGASGRHRRGQLHRHLNRRRSGLRHGQILQHAHIKRLFVMREQYIFVRCDDRRVDARCAAGQIELSRGHLDGIRQTQGVVAVGAGHRRIRDAFHGCDARRRIPQVLDEEPDRVRIRIRVVDRDAALRGPAGAKQLALVGGEPGMP